MLEIWSPRHCLQTSSLCIQVSTAVELSFVHTSSAWKQPRWISIFMFVAVYSIWCFRITQSYVVSFLFSTNLTPKTRYDRLNTFLTVFPLIRRVSLLIALFVERLKLLNLSSNERACPQPIYSYFHFPNEHPFAFCTVDYPRLKRNCMYFVYSTYKTGLNAMTSWIRGLCRVFTKLHEHTNF